jgi:hypothetical protein
LCCTIFPGTIKAWRPYLDGNSPLEQGSSPAKTNPFWPDPNTRSSRMSLIEMIVSPTVAFPPLRWAPDTPSSFTYYLVRRVLLPVPKPHRWSQAPGSRIRSRRRAAYVPHAEVANEQPRSLRRTAAAMTRISIPGNDELAHATDLPSWYYRPPRCSIVSAESAVSRPSRTRSLREP